jgi:hypothetical protein
VFVEGGEAFVEGREVFVEGREVFVEGREVFVEGREVFVGGRELFAEGREVFVEGGDRLRKGGVLLAEGLGLRLKGYELVPTKCVPFRVVGEWEGNKTTWHENRLPKMGSRPPLSREGTTSDAVEPTWNRGVGNKMKNRQSPTSPEASMGSL